MIPTFEYYDLNEKLKAYFGWIKALYNSYADEFGRKRLENVDDLEGLIERGLCWGVNDKVRAGDFSNGIYFSYRVAGYLIVLDLFNWNPKLKHLDLEANKIINSVLNQSLEVMPSEYSNLFGTALRPAYDLPVEILKKKIEEYEPRGSKIGLIF